MGKDWRDRLRPQPTPSLTNTLDYLPTAAPTSQYLDTSKVAVASVSMGGILYTIIWLIVYFIRRIRYPTKLYERIKNKNELPDGEEVFLHHSLASYEEVKENPIDYYVLDPSGDSSIMVPLKPDAYVSPYRAYVKLPQGRLSRGKRLCTYTYMLAHTIDTPLPTNCNAYIQISIPIPIPFHAITSRFITITFYVITITFLVITHLG